MLQTWLKTKPADVTFRRIPVMFQPRWENLAKVYYTLEALGEETKLSPEVFVALHARKAPLWNEKDVLRLGGDQGPRPQEGRGALQLVRHRRARSTARSSSRRPTDPVGADDHRRRQVRDRSRALHGRTRRHSAAIDALVQRRAPSGRSPSRRKPSTRAMRVFLTGASSGLGEALARHYAAQRRDARPVCAARSRARARSAASLGAGDRGDLPRRRARAGGRSRAPAPISSRASACPTSSSPTRASRAAR